MKFARRFPQHQVQEWAAYYVDYKDLKKMVSLAASDARQKHRDTADLDDFFALFDRSMAVAVAFHNRRLTATRRRISTLQARFGATKDLFQHDLRELLWALLKASGDLENLLWFGEVNRKALLRIARTSAIKVPAMTDAFAALISKVNAATFDLGKSTARLLVDVNEWTTRLQDAAPHDEPSAAVTEAAASARLGAAPPVDAVKGAIRSDDPGALQAALSELKHYSTVGKGKAAQVPASESDSEGDIDSYDGGSPSPAVENTCLLSFLHQAASARASQCTAHLLSVVDSLEDPSEINERNYLHRLVVQVANTRARANVEAHHSLPLTTPLLPNMARNEQSILLENEAEDRIRFLGFVLNHLTPAQRASLLQRDSFGRMPLHYAVRFGLLDASAMLVARMEEWGQIELPCGIDASGLQDDDGHSPLHLAVISHHPEIARVLLNGGRLDGTPIRRLPFVSGEMLMLAVKSESRELVDMLLEAGMNVNWQDINGETALLTAARLGFVDIIDALLRPGLVVAADVGMVEKVFSRTALHVAAVHGHGAVVDRLLAGGADTLQLDSVGWTAKEHAAYRGYLVIADRLGAAAHSLTTAETVNPENDALDLLPSLARRGPALAPLTDQSLIMVSLGSLVSCSGDSDRVKKALSLDRVPLTMRHLTGYATAMSLEISARGASGDPVVIDLPLIEDIATRPALFFTDNLDEASIQIDILPAHADDSRQEFLVGRAIVSVSSLRRPVPLLLSMVSPLRHDVTLPIMGPDLEVIGTVTFSVLVITPLPALSAPLAPPARWPGPESKATTSKATRSTTTTALVIGHRGLGMNDPTRRSLQMGENTVASMQGAGRLGADMVEFDVQVTKDLVPVIYHDTLVNETGVDVPVSALSLEQFLHLNDGGQSQHGGHQVIDGTRPRALSLDAHDDGHWRAAMVEAAQDRTRHTFKMRRDGYVPNSRGGAFVQAALATLEDLLTAVPVSIGFNLEFKFPLQSDVQEWGVDGLAVEINQFCDAVVAAVLVHGHSRRVMFSSFEPDVCLCLRLKQDAVPVLLLTDANARPQRPSTPLPPPPLTLSMPTPRPKQLRLQLPSRPHTDGPALDIRISSLHQATSFAKRWDLLGIVTHAQPFLVCPRLVGTVRERGLFCVTYGRENTVPGLVKIQLDAGIDGLITDKIGVVQKQMTGHGNGR